MKLNFFFKKQSQIYLIGFLFILGLAIASQLYLNYEKKKIVEDVYSELTSLSSFKAHQVENWLNERFVDVIHFSTSPLYSDAIKKLISERDSNQELKIADRNEMIRSLRGFADVHIATKDELLPFSTKLTFDSIPLFVNEYIDSSIESKEIILTDFWLEPISKKNYIATLAPIVDSKGESFAVLIFYIDPEAFLYKLLEFSPSKDLVKTTLLFQKKSKQIYSPTENYIINATNLLTIEEATDTVFKMHVSDAKMTLCSKSEILNAPWSIITLESEENINSRYAVYQIITYNVLGFVIGVFLTGLFWIYQRYKKNLIKRLLEEEKISNQQLSESEAKFRAVIENSLDAILFLKTNGEILYCSPNIVRFFDKDEGHVIGQKLQKFIVHDQIELMNNQLNNILKKDVETITERYRLVCSTDNCIWGEVTLNNQLMTENLNAIVVNIKDVSEQYEHEKQIFDLLSFKSTILDNAAYAIIATDTEGKITLFNKTAESILGYSSAEILNTATPLLFHLPSEIEERARKLTEIYKRQVSVGFEVFTIDVEVGYPQEYTWTYKRKDGSTFPVNLRVTVLKDAANNITGYMGIAYDISDKVSAEEQKKLNEKRLQSMVNIMQYPIDKVSEFLDFTLDEAISLTNSKIGYIYYYDELNEEFILNSWSKDAMKDCEIMNPMTCYALDKTGLWGEVVRQRQAILINDFESEHPLKKGYPEGHVRLSKFLSVPIFDKEKIVAVIGVANKKADYKNSDVLQLTLLMDTAWRMVENYKSSEALKISEENFTNIYNLVPDGIVITRLDNAVILNANPAYTEMTGYLPEEYIGKTSDDLKLWANEEQRDNFRKLFLENNKLTDFDIDMRIKDGSILKCLFSVITLKYNYEDCLLVEIRNVTEWKNQEEALKNNRNRLKRAQSIGNIGYTEFIYGDDAIWMNSEGMRIYGFEPVDGYIKSSELIKCIPDIDSIRETARKTLEKGEKFDLEFRIVPKNSNLDKFIHMIQEQEIDLGKGITKIVSFFQDITERKKMDMELKDLNLSLESKVEKRTEELARVNKDLEAFAYSVSHDLRAPIRHVDGFLKLMYSRIDSPSTQITNYYNKISSATRRMSKMIDDLLSFSRLGRKSIVLIDIDLNGLIEEIVEQLLPETTNRNIKWLIEDLPTIQGDRNLLRFAFENLISNALKYTSKNEHAVIEIGYKKPSDDKVELYIKDNGVGFAMEYVDKLFGVFQRLHTDEEFEGTGIGLANVKQIILKHNGSIKAEGKVDEGATFFINLPLSN